MQNENALLLAKMFVEKDGAKIYKSKLCSTDLQMVKTGEGLFKKKVAIIATEKCASQILNRVFLNFCQKVLSSKKYNVINGDASLVENVKQTVNKINDYYFALKDDATFDEAVDSYATSLEQVIDIHVRDKQVFFNLTDEKDRQITSYSHKIDKFCQNAKEMEM